MRAIAHLTSALVAGAVLMMAAGPGVAAPFGDYPSNTDDMGGRPFDDLAGPTQLGGPFYDVPQDNPLTLDTWYADAPNTAGIASLPAAITVNGTTLTPTFRYVGPDADGTDWDADGYGETLTAQGSGGSFDQDVPTLNASDGAMESGVSRYYQASNQTFGNVGTDDLLFFFVVRNDHFDESAFYAEKRVVGGDFTGWSLFQSAGGNASFVVDAGASAASAVSPSDLDSGYNLLGVLLDRDDTGGSGLILYENAKQTATADASGASGSLDSSSTFTLAKRSDGSGVAAGAVAFAIGYTCSDCLSHGDTAHEDELVRMVMARIAGVYPRIARGTETPSTISRGSPARLRKCTDAGVCTMFDVGSNWPRVVKTPEATGYISEPSRENLCLQSEDLTTSWSVNAGSVGGSVVAPDGSTCTTCGVIADGTSTNHRAGQSILMPAGIVSCSTWAQKGDLDWMLIAMNSAGGEVVYFDLANGVVESTPTNVIDAFIEDWGNDWYRVGVSYTAAGGSDTFDLYPAEAEGDIVYAGDSSAVNTYFWGMTCEAGEYPSSYVATTTAAVTRASDSLENGSLTIDDAQGSIVVDYWCPSFDLASDVWLAAAANGTSNDNRVSVEIDATNDRSFARLISGGTNQGTVLGSGDVVDGAARTLATNWSTDYLTTFEDGSKGSQDSSLTVPIGLDTMHIGQTNARSGQPGCIIERVRLYGRSGVTQ